MSIATPGLTNFTAGEISPRLSGRVDLSKYYSGCRSLSNFLVHPHGGATRRSGFRFVCETANQAAPSVLVPFEHNATQGYVLEFSVDALGRGLMRVFMDQGRVMSDGGHVSIATPYDAADLERLKYVQSNDTLILTHPKYAPRKLTRSSHDQWQMQEISFTGRPKQWEPGNWPSVACFFEERLVFAATPRQPNTLWFSRTGDYYDMRTNTREVPLEGWDEMELRDGNNDGNRDGRNGDTFVVLDGGRFEKGSVVRGQNPDGEKRFYRYKGDKEFLPMGADKTVTLRDEPGAADIKAVHAPDKALNSEEWEALSVGQRIDNPEAGEPLADDGMEITLSAAQANAVEFLAPKARLWVGTSGGEWTVGGAASGDALTPASVKASQEGTCGASGARPEPVASASLFIQRAARKVREMHYRFDTDAYVSRDLTILSEHITAPGLKQLAYAQEPDSLVWCLRTDGVLLSLTYQPDQDVLAWARHETQGRVECACTAYNGRTLLDELWIVVRRTVNGVDKRFVEFLEATFEQGETGQAFFLDSGLSYRGEPVQRFEGLRHLAGEKVTLLADGLVLPDRLVAPDGSIQLERPATEVHAGLTYRSLLQPMPLEGGSSRGTSQTKSKRITQVAVRFFNTLGGGIGPDPEHLEPVYYLTSAAPQGRCLPLWTGDKKVKFPKGWNQDGVLTIVQDQPLPMTVLMIVPEVLVNE